MKGHLRHVVGCDSPPELTKRYSWAASAACAFACLQAAAANCRRRFPVPQSGSAARDRGFVPRGLVLLRQEQDESEGAVRRIRWAGWLSGSVPAPQGRRASREGYPRTSKGRRVGIKVLLGGRSCSAGARLCWSSRSDGIRVCFERHGRVPG